MVTNSLAAARAHIETVCVDSYADGFAVEKMEAGYPPLAVETWASTKRFGGGPIRGMDDLLLREQD